MARFFILFAAIWLAASYGMKYFEGSDWFWAALIPAVYVLCLPLLMRSE